MPLRRFLPYDIIGAGLWGTTFCLLGYVFWQSFDKVADYAGRGALALGTVIVVVVGVDRGLPLAARGRQPRQGPRLAARAGRAAGAAAAGPRRAARSSTARSCPPARALPGRRASRLDRFTPGDLGLELTTLVAVAAVGSFAFFAFAFSVGPGEPLPFTDRRAVRHRQRPVRRLAGGRRQGGHRARLAAVRRRAVCLVAASCWPAGARGWASRRSPSGPRSSFAGVHIAKAAVDRPRPADSLVDTSGSAYPSGHAAYSVAWVAVAVLLARFVPWLAGPRGRRRGRDRRRRADRPVARLPARALVVGRRRRVGAGRLDLRSVRHSCAARRLHRQESRVRHDQRTGHISSSPAAAP